jgi:hypothetical protein
MSSTLLKSNLNEQELDRKLNICNLCKFYNVRPIKSESKMDDYEKAIYKVLLSTGYKDPVHRTMILHKSNLGFWTYLCSQCSKNKPADWD